jgi:hypothetical protein
MTWIKKIWNTLAYITFLSIASFFLLEVLFSFLPVTESSEVQDVNAENAILKFKANSEFRKTLGHDFKHVTIKRTNDFGYFSDYDFNANYDKKIAVVIGDSFVEAAYVENKKTFHGLLNEQIEEFVFLPMGVTGSSLAQYLAFADWAKKNLNPELYFISIIRNDFDESSILYKQVPGHHYFDEKMKLVRLDRKVSTLNKVLRSSSFVRYLYLDYQITLRTPILRNDKLLSRFLIWLTGPFTVPKKKEVENKDYVDSKFKNTDKIIDAFIDQLHEITQGKPVYFVLDSDRANIYGGVEVAELRAHIWSPYILYSFKTFKEKCCEMKNFSFIDTDSFFRESFLKNSRRFEFENDWHWNSLGHATVASAIKNEIQKEISATSGE